MATARDIPTDLALEIGEDLDPRRFVAVTRAFFDLVGDIARGEGSAFSDWRVKVREGSNILALAPSPDMPPDVASHGLATTQKAMEALVSHDLAGFAFSDVALDRALKLSDMARGRGEAISLRIWIRRQPLVFGPDIAEHIREEARVAYSDYGSVEGVLNAIQDGSGGLEIRVRDPLWRRPIRCFLPERMLEDAMGHFRERVELFGEIEYRKDDTPNSIRVDRLEPLAGDADLPSIDEVRGLFGRSDLVAE